MNKDGYTKVATQGKITANVMPDIDEFRERKYQASIKGGAANNLYPGGAENMNHWILSGEPVYGWRKSQYTGSEVVFSDLCGLDHTQNLEREMYFVGIATGESKFEGDQVYGDPESNNEIAVDKAGMRTIVNNGPYDIMAGDPVCFYYPSCGPRYLLPSAGGRPQ